MFAKIYGTDEYQILVKKDRNKKGFPEIRFYCEPELLGVCSLAISFSDDEKGWDKADRLLSEMTEVKAREMCKHIVDAFPG